MAQMYTTLNKIKQNEPCSDGWKKLLTFLNKTEADDEQLLISSILDSNGLDDALWALRAVDGFDKEIRLMAADFADSVLCIFEVKYPNDDRPRKAIQAARDYANGLITVEDLSAARSAAWDAARSAAWSAARDAAWDAARSAAWDAARSAARDAAWDAARSAAWDAAWSAARDAAWSAAMDAAWSAAMDDEKLNQIEIMEKYI